MKRPRPHGDDLAVIDAPSVCGKLLLVLANEEIDEIVFGLSPRWCGQRRLCALPVMEHTGSPKLAFHGIDLDGIGGGEGIVVDPDLVTPQCWIDPVETLVEADVGQVLVDDPGELAQEGSKHLVHFHVADDGESRMIAALWSLSGLGMDGIIIIQ